MRSRNPSSILSSVDCFLENQNINKFCGNKSSSEESVLIYFEFLIGSVVGHYDLHNFNSNVITFKKVVPQIVLLNYWMIFSLLLQSVFFFCYWKNTFLKNQKIDFSEKLKNEVFEILTKIIFH